MQHTRPGLSALAGQIIGYRRDGRPIRLAAGGSEDSAASSSDSDSSAGTGAGDGQDSAGGAGNDTGDTGKTPQIRGEFDPDRAARALAAAREAERKAKEKARAADERLAAILKAAGLAPDGKEDPAEQLKAAREAAERATARARQTAVELAVYRSAGKVGADPDAVLDSRAFLAAVADLDPDAKDFADRIADAIKSALKNNPKLAAAGQGAAGRQGADHTGGGGRGRPASIHDAVKRALGG